MHLHPFVFSNGTHRDTINFSRGLSGVCLKFKASAFSEHLVAVVTPMYVSNNTWVIQYDQTKEHIFYIGQDPFFAHIGTQNFDFSQWNQLSIDAFWKECILRISCEYHTSGYLFTFEKRLWDGHVYKGKETRVVSPWKSGEFPAMYRMDTEVALSPEAYQQSVIASRKQKKRKEALKRKANWQKYGTSSSKSISFQERATTILQWLGLHGNDKKE